MVLLSALLAAIISPRRAVWADIFSRLSLATAEKVDQQKPLPSHWSGTEQKFFWECWIQDVETLWSFFLLHSPLLYKLWWETPSVLISRWFDWRWFWSQKRSDWSGLLRNQSILLKKDIWVSSDLNLIWIDEPCALAVVFIFEYTFSISLKYSGCRWTLCALGAFLQRQCDCQVLNIGLSFAQNKYCLTRYFVILCWNHKKIK